MEERLVKPEVLDANQPLDRFYAGGRQIARFRGVPPIDSNVPEDWVASTTPLFGETELGLSRLPDGELLADAVRRDPAAWLGPQHVAAFGDDTALLVKLLDAGQRLPVHAHPNIPFAREHLGLAHGKTEAWVFLEPATVHLAFTREVGEDELARWVKDQDASSMLAAMHALPVQCGDAVLVPAGLPHAIGDGAFLVELQEPTDLSILMEWDGFDIDGAELGHLGLGFDTALRAVDRRAWSFEQVEALRGARDSDTGDLLPDAAEFFRVERTRGAAQWDAGFAVLVVVARSGQLVSGDSDALPVHSGQTIVLPFAAGPCRLTGDDPLEVLRCRPPAASSAPVAAPGR
jgi:mannose-6-phosphate isomerase